MLLVIESITWLFCVGAVDDDVKLVAGRHLLLLVRLEMNFEIGLKEPN